MQSKLYYEIEELLEGQRSIINRQLELIAKLVNENAEKENMINVLMNESYDV